MQHRGDTRGDGAAEATTADSPEDVYAGLVRDHSAALFRLARGYEADPDKQRDLHQEIFIAIWRALPSFEARSSLRTWVYRIAHNVAVSHVAKAARDRPTELVPLDALEAAPGPADLDAELDQREAVARLAELVRTLRPLDRQVILLHLEGVEQSEIAEIAGISRDNVSTKVHRIKTYLTRQMNRGGRP